MSDNKLLLALQRLDKHDLNAMPRTEKRDVLGVIAGVMVAMRLPLPTTPVTEVVNYYVSTHEPVAAKAFDQVNEQLFINTNKAIEIARNVYMMRYRLVFDDSAVLGLLGTLNGSNAMLNLPAHIASCYNMVTPDVMAKAAEYYF